MHPIDQRHGFRRTSKEHHYWNHAIICRKLLVFTQNEENDEHIPQVQGLGIKASARAYVTQCIPNTGQLS